MSNVIIETAELEVITENYSVITWSGNNGYGQLDIFYNGDGGYTINAEFLSVETMIKIFQKVNTNE